MKVAQVVINCADLDAEVVFFSALGFKLSQVFPADNPRMMLMSTAELTLRLEKNDNNNAVTLMLAGDTAQKPQLSPHGVVVKFHTDIEMSSSWPKHIDCVVNQFDQNESWITGRAGMLYRDLIPCRLAGAIIASNIMIPEGGPVADHVHHHSIQFQLIFCTKGWVKVVYEDQGEAFILKAGDCVTQPPGIRHQVLEASDGMEVVEIGLPAEHMTALDYSLKLPTGRHLPDRLYGEFNDNQQNFCHHQQSKATWIKLHDSGLLRSETTVVSDSGGLAAVNVIKIAVAQDNKQILSIQHPNVLHFYYIMSGQVTLDGKGLESINLKQRDSFVVPAGQVTELSHFSNDFQCIEFIWLGV